MKLKIPQLCFFSWFIFIASSSLVQAQMYVGPNSYMYVKDQYVYAKQDVQLNAATSNIYLRDNGQLLQGTTGAGANSGIGSLSVFQEGSVNNFQYNYWCSPVGGTIAAAGNSAFGITQLGVPTSVTATTPANILVTSNNDGFASLGAVNIAQRWIYKFTTGSVYAQWSQVASASILNAGQGFTMKGTSGSDATVPFVGAGANNSGSKQRYDFRGKPNDGTINVPVLNANMTLTGNPYPSAIDLNLFLTDPTNAALLDGTALFWEHDKTANSHLLVQYRGGYGVYNGTTSIYTPATFYTYTGSGTQGALSSTPMHNFERRFSPVGQGFMIRGIAAGNVQIKNTHRVFRKEGLATNSEFERNATNQQTTTDYGFYEDIPNVAGVDYTQVSKAPTPHININASLNNTAVRQIALVFMDAAVDGLDKADSKSADIEANLPYDMYLFLNNTEYLHSATNFSIDKKFPVGFKNNTPATFRIQVADFVNFDGANQVFLHDKVTGVYHDIKNGEYELSLPVGVVNDRFEITFQEESLSTSENLNDAFTVYQNNVSSNLTIKNPKSITIKSCTLYDISGKTIFSKLNLGSNAVYEFPTSALAEGVYIVKLIAEDNQEIAKKVSIFNKK
ncbi:T9SS sorting signal type C domain-containing protein [Flavobacterium sp.]|uniref:T9SS sorting signal type C domain-containing protein n=1 Tax=Flavobacterium sp. TaxID=239 RepID=UPI00261A6E7E|nr:T9SS sorting signal type C domain-containing protein [Flavobacterium sp.]